MSKCHLNEEQGEYSRKKTECTRSGASREHCIFEELQLHVAGMGNKMSLESRNSIAHWGELKVLQQDWALERKGYMVKAELGEDSQIVVSVSPLAINEKTAKR